MTTTSTAAALPKILATLVADAEANGMKVTVDRDERSVGVYVETAYANASVTFSVQGVYDTSLRCERLGFRTTAPSRYVMKFDHGTGYARGSYSTLRSVRQARGIVGLPC